MATNWKEEYSVKVKEIDDQHKGLILIINKLYELLESGREQEDLEPLLNKLIVFTDVHFSTEEKYFDKFHYEHSKEHKEEHEIFRKKILEFSRNFEKGKAKITQELLDFLVSWLKNHLIVQDQKYVKCFTEHGLR